MWAVPRPQKQANSIEASRLQSIEFVFVFVCSPIWPGRLGQFATPSGRALRARPFGQKTKKKQKKTLIDGGQKLWAKIL